MQRALWQAVVDQIGELRDKSKEGGAFVFESEASKKARAEVKLDFEVSHEGVKLMYKNVPSITVKFYESDLELQFSTAPFRQKDNAYNYVQATATLVANPEDTEGETLLPLPEACLNKNTVVEVT